MVEAMRESLANNYKEQNEENKTENEITLKIRMNNGKILNRFFEKNDLLQNVYNFVFVNCDKGTNNGFILKQNFPNKEFGNLYQTLEDAGLGDMDSLNVVFV